jgi:hypothetical protein
MQCEHFYKVKVQLRQRGCIIITIPAAYERQKLCLSTLVFERTAFLNRLLECLCAETVSLLVNEH